MTVADGTLSLRGCDGDDDGIERYSESDCPIEAEVDKREELKVLDGPPARVEIRDCDGSVSA